MKPTPLLVCALCQKSPRCVGRQISGNREIPYKGILISRDSSFILSRVVLAKHGGLYLLSNDCRLLLLGFNPAFTSSGNIRLSCSHTKSTTAVPPLCQ